MDALKHIWAMADLGWSDAEIAFQFVLVLLAVVVSWTPNIHHRARTKVAFTVAFVILGFGAWFCAREDRAGSLARAEEQHKADMAELTGGDNHLVVRVGIDPNSKALQFFSFNDGKVPLHNPQMAVSIPPACSYGQPNYHPFALWWDDALAAGDWRPPKIQTHEIIPGIYCIELAGLNGPFFEDLTLMKTGADAYLQHRQRPR
jgi:hypothetical protein